ncbi:MAG: cytochrome c biogenesis protein CcsA, partial [Acidimicrobiia bacterium]|nr:cytochrome c biogenesis protein CcsA [Acidimicrobiia bacterium]
MTSVKGTWLGRATAVAVAVALILAFVSPREVNLGQSSRLFFLHVPSIAVAYIAFTVTLVASGFYLATRDMKWDHLALATAEVGAVFTGLTILIGMIWAKPTWGVFWTWSARLTLTAIMFFVYLGYLALRRAISDPEVRARRAAVLGMLSIVQIPIVHFSVTWWRDIHQPGTIARPGEMQMDTPLLVAFYAAFIAFVLLSFQLVRQRRELAQLDYEREISDPDMDM